MKEYAVRLKKGEDLYNYIKDYCIKNDIKAGVILSGVGCLSEAKMRDAGGVNIQSLNEPLEICGLMGTVSKERLHIHIALAKEDLSVVGGHMVPGCIVNTTCELVILAFDRYEFSKEFDQNTGYNELLIKEI